MYKGILSLLITFLFSQAVFSQVPVITSFGPTAGAIGTTVNILGSNFDNAAANNIVFFGAVKANILSASDTQIVVKVPPGASYEPISVTTHNLIAYSNNPFKVIFTNDNPAILTNSFAPKVDYYINQGGGDFGVLGSAVSDLDEDGKPDIIIMKNVSNIFYAFSVFRNTSENGVASFASRQNFGYPLQNSSDVCIRDLDADGKPDIFILNGGGGSYVVSFYQNTSTPGNISFAPKIDFQTGGNGGGVSIGDLDNDGKPDMVVANGNGTTTISVFRNTSSIGFTSFAPKVDYVTGNLPYSVAIQDLNNDGKADLAVANSSDTTAVVFKNTSVTGTISFDAPATFPIGSAAYSIRVADLEGDGKPDIITANSYSNTFSVLKNTSNAGLITFASKIDYITGNTPYGFSIGDMDGDSLPDVVVANNGIDSVSIYKNVSNGGIIAFAAGVSYRTGLQPRDVSVGDFNGDGKPDMVTANWLTYNASIFINKIGDSVITNLCPPASDTVLTSDLNGNSYQWQVNTGSGFVNINNNVNYNGTNTIALQLSNIPSAWYGSKYRCFVNGNYSSIFTLHFTNYWTGAINIAWENPLNWSCGVVPDINTDVNVESGTITLNASTSIRSLTLGAGVIFTAVTGAVLTITH